MTVVTYVIIASLLLIGIGILIGLGINTIRIDI